jgi:uncharacterized membrane protein
MSKDLSPTQKLTMSAMLLALAVLMTIIAKEIFRVIPLNGSFAFVRLSLTPAIIIYTSIVLGPFYGALVGGCADLIPAFAFPTGDFNFLITIVYLLLGILPWALEKLTKRERSSLKKPWILYCVLALIIAIMALLFYATDLFDSSFGTAAVWAKPTILAVMLVMDVGFCFALYFTNKYYQARILEYPDIPSPNEIALIGLITEVTLMDALKALAFWVFYTWVAGEKIPLHFGLLFSIFLLVSPVDLLLITFADSWLLIYTRRFIRSYSFKIEGQKKSRDKGSVDAEGHKGEPSLEENDETEGQRRAKIGWIVFFTVVIVSMIICIIVIRVMNEKGAQSSQTSKLVLNNLFWFLDR